ncbi:MAG TPA: hypothetical protein VMG59_02480 [Phycisphaerae bacterium]|nr:hypothetical protein [Phycisphaerae bacterium]
MGKFSKTRGKFNDMVFVVTIVAVAVTLAFYTAHSYIRTNADCQTLPVSVNMGSFSPGVVAVQQDAYDDCVLSATSSLSANYSTPNNDPTFDEDTITEEYDWSVTSVRYNASDDDQYALTTSGFTDSISPTQPSSNSEATLTFTPQITGYWEVYTSCTVTLNDNETDQSWTGYETAQQSLTSYIMNIIYTGDVMDANGNAVSFSSTNNNSNIATNQTLQVEAGWPIGTVSVQVSPTDQTTTYQWSVAGSGSAETAIDKLDEAADDSALVVIPLGYYNTDLTMEALPTFYFVDNSSHAVSCTATVDGQQFSAQTTFASTKPSYQITVYTDTVNLDQHQGYGTAYGVGFGDSGLNPPEYGIYFSATGNLNNCQGVFSWLQIYSVNDTATDASNNHYSCFGTGLDGQDPYIGTISQFLAIDAPSRNLTNFVSCNVNDNPTMWLMFTPSLTGSIRVPIQKIGWYWNAEAVYDTQDNQWTLMPNSNSMPILLSYPPGTHSTPTGQTGSPTNKYPTWNDLVPTNWTELQ